MTATVFIGQLSTGRIRAQLWRWSEFGGALGRAGSTRIPKWESKGAAWRGERTRPRVQPTAPSRLARAWVRFRAVSKTRAPPKFSARARKTARGARALPRQTSEFGLNPNSEAGMDRPRPHALGARHSCRRRPGRKSVCGALPVGEHFCGLKAALRALGCPATSGFRLKRKRTFPTAWFRLRRNCPQAGANQFLEGSQFLA